MLFDLLGFALWNSQIADVFMSPSIVPVAGCAMIGSIVVASLWSGVRTREMKSQERLAMIAQGLQPEPDWDEATVRAAAGGQTAAAPPGKVGDGARARRAGLILCSVGVGLMLFFTFLAMVVGERAVLSGAAAGILPLAIGVGFLFDGRMRNQEYERWMAATHFGSPGLGGPAAGVPPPPPVGMSGAQASDWRPLH